MRVKRNDAWLVSRLVQILILGLLLQVPAISWAAQADQKSADFPRLDSQSYGDFTYRDTNFSRGGYNTITGWWETRFILRTKEKISPEYRFLMFEPYGKFTLALSGKSSAWENNLVYGLGLENRFLSTWNTDRNPCKELASRLRFYFEYLGMTPIKDQPDPWVPVNDLRVGVDLWKEWNIPPDPKVYKDDPLWGELWFILGWRKTNFNLSDYKTYNNGLMGRLGLRHDKPLCLTESGVQALLLPYIMVETGYTGKDYFWENRLNVGGGLRFMFTLPTSNPSGDLCVNPKKLSESKPIIMRLYAEGLHTLTHYRGIPDPGTPENDFRIGINFSYNLF